MQDVQEALLESTPAIEPALVDSSAAHMTLAVMALEDEERVKEAAAALESFRGVLEEKAFVWPLRLQLEGLSHFNNKVGGVFLFALCI